MPHGWGQAGGRSADVSANVCLCLMAGVKTFDLTNINSIDNAITIRTDPAIKQPNALGKNVTFRGRVK